MEEATARGLTLVALRSRSRDGNVSAIAGTTDQDRRFDRIRTIRPEPA
jgi:hypothetical protein